MVKNKEFENCHYTRFNLSSPYTGSRKLPYKPMYGLSKKLRILSFGKTTAMGLREKNLKFAKKSSGL